MNEPIHASGHHIVGSTSAMLQAYQDLCDRFPIVRRSVVRINGNIESALKEMGERRIILPHRNIVSFPYGVRVILSGRDTWEVFPSEIGVGRIEDLLPEDIAAYWDPARVDARPFRLKSLASALEPEGYDAFGRGDGYYTALIGNRIHWRGKVYRNKPV